MRRKLKDSSQLLDKIDECKETNSRNWDSNDDDKIDHLSKISDCVSLDDSILDEFPQTQELMSEQYVSKNKKEIRHSYSVSHLTGKNSSCNILQQEPTPSCYTKREYNHIFIFYVCVSEFIR